MSELLGKEELKELSIDELLDIDLEAVEDMQGFLLPPKGFYRLVINESGLSEAGDTQVIKIGLAIGETLELVNSSDEPAPEGGQFDQTYFPGFGVQQFKTEFAEVAKSQGFTTFGELINGLAGMEITAHIGHRKDKNDKDKFYPTISKIEAV